MTYEEAKKIALKLNDRFNACREFKKGFHFYEETDVDIVGDSGAVVLKSNGLAINWI